MKVISKLNLEVFNHLMSQMPKGLFSQNVIFTERCRRCAECKYISADYKCALSDCKWITNSLFNLKGVCKKKRW